MEKTSILTMAVMSLCALYTLLLTALQQAKARIAACSSIRILKRRPVLAEAIADLKKHSRLLSLIVLSGLEAFQCAPSSVSDTEAVLKVAPSAMRRCERTIRFDTQRSLVGLLRYDCECCTFDRNVCHDIRNLSSFEENDSNATGLQIVSFGVAFALIPLAIGLSVALLSAWGCGTVSRAAGAF